MSPAVISSNMFVIVVKMMSTLSSVCPVLAIELLQLSKNDSRNIILHVQSCIINCTCQSLDIHVHVCPDQQKWLDL